MPYLLRPWKPDDLAGIARHADNTAITSFMSDGFPDTVSKWEAFLRFAAATTGVLYMAIEVEGAAVGGIGVNPQKDIYRKNAELGYWLSEMYWKRGIMTGAVKEIVGRAFSEYDIDRIFATPFATNRASHRVLEKAGFVLEARFEKTVIKQGEILDQLVYAVRRPGR